MTTCVNRCVEARGARGTEQGGLLIHPKDTIINQVPKRKLPIPMMERETNVIPIQGTPITIRINTNNKTINTTTSNTTTTMPSIGLRRISIVSGKISRRNSGHGVMPETLMRKRRRGINGGHMTSTIESTESMKKNSTGNRRNSSGSRKRHVNVPAQRSLGRVRRLKKH
jgi:hypothetical protein